MVSGDRLKASRFFSRPATRPSEAELESAFEALFNAQWGRVHDLLAGLVGDADEAEDLALEAFTRLHDRLEDLNQSDNPGGWLYRVAFNLGLNALRQRYRRKRYEERAGRDALRTASPSNPALDVEADEERKQVRHILAEMKPASARLLYLRSSGLSYQELAQACELSAGSIGTLLNRAEQEFEKRYRARFGDRR